MNVRHPESIPRRVFDFSSKKQITSLESKPISESQSKKSDTDRISLRQSGNANGRESGSGSENESRSDLSRQAGSYNINPTEGRKELNFLDDSFIIPNNIPGTGFSFLKPQTGTFNVERLVEDNIKRLSTIHLQEKKELIEEIEEQEEKSIIVSADIIKLPIDPNKAGMTAYYRKVYKTLELPAPPPRTLGKTMHSHLKSFLETNKYSLTTTNDELVYTLGRIIKQKEIISVKETERIRISNKDDISLKDYGFVPVDFGVTFPLSFLGMNYYLLYEKWNNIENFKGQPNPGFKNGPIFLDRLTGNIYQTTETSFHNWWESTKIFSNDVFQNGTLKKSFFERREEILSSRTGVYSKGVPVAYYVDGEVINPAKQNPRVHLIISYINAIKDSDTVKEMLDFLNNGYKLSFQAENIKDIGEITPESVYRVYNDLSEPFGAEIILAAYLTETLPKEYYQLFQ